MIISHIAKADWKKFSADAHLTVFNEHYDPATERIDFALIAADDHKTPILYCTFNELDLESVYMSFGGSFPPYRGSPEAFRAFAQFISVCSQKFKHLYYHTENENYAMLKMGIKVGAKIVGISHTKIGKILLEHHLELRNV